MKENNVILLKQNSLDIRQAIKDSGIDVCICAEFKDSIWLDYYPNVGSVHGVGFYDENTTQAKVLAFVEYEWKENNTTVIECKDVQEFINEIFKSGYGNETK